MLATPMLVAVLLSVPMPASTASASFQEQGPTPAPSQPLTYPLLCRGGGLFIFDTLRRRDNDAVLEMAMRFSPASSAAGADGAGLPQGTCAWIDRPLVAAEPGLILFNHPLADPVGPSETLSRPDRYWQFTVYNTGLGHLEAVGHGAWSRAVATRSPPQLPLSFPYFVELLPENLRPFAALFPIMLAFMLLTLLLRFGRKGGPSRLGELYPAVARAPGTRFRMDRAVFGRGYSSMAWVRIGTDHERLHVRVVSSFQGGGAFSVPLDEVTATPDRYAWMVLTPDTVRLRFARAPEELMMIFPRHFARLVEASGGRLRLEAVPASGARAPAPADRSS